MGKMFEALRKTELEKSAEFAEYKEEVSETVPADVVFDDKLVAYYQRASMVSEQFRRLRTYITSPRLDGTYPKTILVTSTLAGEGKSLIAANLAVMIAAELQSYALLVDCDLRSPSLSQLFGLQQQKGLSNYLAGETKIEEILMKTSIDKLSILPGGSLEENPVELIGSIKMKSLVQDLKSRYDDRFIIFDSSPILPTTEPSVLNKMVDGIIMVIMSGKTPRESITQAIKSLDEKKILGVVLNNLEFKTNAMFRKHFGSDHYYYNYNYDYARSDTQPNIWGKIKDKVGDIKIFRK
ncbi:MAG: polysaccharide biosynthesis tyrosine autokinase [Smithellaceae bacterium]|jgi:exopolysaccharide/PEP-CTERM locus tyrosine autokinase